MQSPTSTITIIALAALLIWRSYARFRRMVGRQRLSKVRPWITLGIFSLLIALIAISTRAHPNRLALMAVGLVLGGALGVYGLRKTTFEPTPQGLFYTPNAHLGIALSLLFIARVIYRFVEIYALDHVETGNVPVDFARSPLTLAVFGVLAGYYMCYAIGLARWRLGVMAAKRARELNAARSAPSPATPAAASTTSTTSTTSEPNAGPPG